MTTQDVLCKRKPGKPVVHPKIINPETGMIFITYTEAAIACGGSRFGVMRTCRKLQQHHKGIKFRYIN